MIKLLQEAAQEFEEQTSFHRKASKDCYDKRFLHPKDGETTYDYMHWGVSDIMENPELALSEIYAYYYPLVVVGEKPGEVILRVIKNNDPSPAGKHVDIDFYTLVIGSVMENGKVKMVEDCHYGLQAQYFTEGRLKAKPHMFNPRNSKYDFIMFGNLHYSTPLPASGYKNVGEYLTQVCYS